MRPFPTGIEPRMSIAEPGHEPNRFGSVQKERARRPRWAGVDLKTGINCRAET